jgi:hypothetical protein
MIRLLAILALGLASGAETGRGIHRETPLTGVPPLELAIDGRALAEIVVLPPASAVARYAARELKFHLDRVTGADFPVREARSGTMPALVVGGSPWLPSWGIDTAALPRDGFSIRRSGDLIAIAGRDDPRADPERALAGGMWGMYFERGTLFGVLHFLERFAGVRFYFPGELGTVTPRQTALAVPAVAIDEAPDFPIREMSWYHQPWFGGADAATTLRQQNLQRLRLRGATSSLPNCHGLARLGLAERFAATRPEFFALLGDGSRDSDLAQPGHHGHLCFSDPGLADEIFRDARSFLLGQPAGVRGARCRYGGIWDVSAFQPGFFNIMPQDGHSPLNFCRCPACAPRYAAGRASDVVWDFIAGIARRLQQEQVPGEITAMAYGSCLPVPATDIPSNVRVMVALSGPWSERDPEMLATELELVRAWNAKLGDRRVWLWNYLNNYAGQIPAGVPSPAPRAIAAYYRRMAGHIDGAFLESEVDSFLANYLNWAVGMRVLWNAGTDAEAFLAEHHRLMYGAGAEPMGRLHDALERRWMARGLGRTSLRPDGFVITPPTDAELWQRIYDRGFQEHLDSLIAEALAATTADPASQARIALMRDEMLGMMRRVGERHLADERAITELIARIPPLPSGGTIAIDGRLDETGWRHAAALGLVPLGRHPALTHTRVRALWAPDNLYLGIDCEEPNAAAMRVSARRHDDDALWQDSSLEIFLDPASARRDYRQIIVNPTGSWSDAAFPEAGHPGDWTWESAAMVAARVEDGRWIAELAIPSIVLGADPLRAGREAVANIARSRVLVGAKPEENQLYSWSPFLTRGFHDLPRFGRLLLVEHPDLPLLQNGGFEDAASDGRPERWRIGGTMPSPFRLDGEWFREGCASLRISGGTGQSEISQGLAGLEPGARYRLTFAARADRAQAAEGGAGVEVLVLGRKPLALTTPAIAGSFDWSRRTLEFTAPAAGTETCLRLAASLASGQVWIDAIRLERILPP